MLLYIKASHNLSDKTFYILFTIEYWVTKELGFHLCVQANVLGGIFRPLHTCGYPVVWSLGAIGHFNSIKVLWSHSLKEMLEKMKWYSPTLRTVPSRITVQIICIKQTKRLTFHSSGLKNPFWQPWWLHSKSLQTHDHCKLHSIHYSSAQWKVVKAGANLNTHSCCYELDSD